MLLYAKHLPKVWQNATTKHDKKIDKVKFSGNWEKWNSFVLNFDIGFRYLQFMTTKAVDLAFFASLWTYLKHKDAIISQFVSWRNKLRSTVESVLKLTCFSAKSQGTHFWKAVQSDSFKMDTFSPLLPIYQCFADIKENPP